MNQSNELESLRKFMEDKGWSRNRLAQEFRINPKTVEGWLKGKHRLFVSLKNGGEKMSKLKVKGFAGISRSAMKTSTWKNFSAAAKILYLEIKARYFGPGSKSVSLPYSELLKIKGLKSSRTITSAFKELMDAGWLQYNGKGSFLRSEPSLYKLTGDVDDSVHYNQLRARPKKRRR